MTIRTRVLKDGRQSVFFDIFNDGVRSYKFLKMYLEPEKSAAARKRNADIMKQVEKIRTELALELTYSRAGLEDRSFKSGIRLVDWMNQYKQYQGRNGGSKGFRYNIISTRNYLEQYNSEIILKDVDGKFIDGFIDFLKKQTYTRGEEIASWLTTQYAAVFATCIPPLTLLSVRSSLPSTLALMLRLVWMNRSAKRHT